MSDFPRLRFSSPTFTGDRNNVLFRFGENSIENLISFREAGKQKGKFTPQYPIGFTPKTEFYTNSSRTYQPYSNGLELPIEYGVALDVLPIDKRTALDSEDRVEERKKTLKEFNDYSKEFLHNLDDSKNGYRKIPSSDINTSNIYLGSFVQTIGDNEDPTMLGFDIIIDTTTSPLFNGAVLDFINSAPYRSVTEIKSRESIYIDFIRQFSKYFKYSSDNLLNNDLRNENKKPYYLKSISGLDRLMEQNTSSEFNKSFVKYGDDKITLKLNEDVSQNMGLLSSLYKSLSWSRINGKQAIPHNLLRFNVNIVLSEVRNFNRIIKNNNKNSFSLDVYTDLISKYEYTLYECQFYFPNMPHGSVVDISSIRTIDDFDIQFNYKFSSMRFTKFAFNNDGSVVSEFIDNKLSDVKRITPFDTNRFTSNGFSLSLLDKNIKLKSYKEIKKTERNTIIDSNTGFDGFSNDPIDALKRRSKNIESQRPLIRLRNDLIRAGTEAINRKIITQARLLNKTIENIRNAVPYGGRMSEPTNIYESNQLSLRTDVINAARNFVGRSIRSFFNPPEN